MAIVRLGGIKQQMAVSFGNQDPGLRRRWLGWRALLLCCGLMILSDMAMAVERRIALVIGNAAYAEAPLKNAINDANDMTDKLQAYGFEVTKLLNAGHQEMEDGVRRFTKMLGSEQSVGLFYYAGHGLQVEGQNFLLPINTYIQSEADVRYKTVSANWVLDAMTQAQGGGGINMLVLDACRNNPFSRAVHRGVNRGFARMEPARGTLVLYATEPGKVAQDGDGRNGVFTEKLLQAMDQPGLSVEEVFKNTALAVNGATSKAQTPWQEGVILGHFYFRPLATLANEAPPPTTPQPAQTLAPDIELEFWRSTDKCGTRDCYEDYLQNFPSGRFAGLAKAQLKRLMKTEVTPQAAVTPSIDKTASVSSVSIAQPGTGGQPTTNDVPTSGEAKLNLSGYSQLDDWLFGKGEKR